MQSAWFILLLVEINKALDQLSEIHRHLSKTEVYRGIGAFPVALAGTVALLAGLVQPYFVESANPSQFVIYWSIIALMNIILAFSTISYNYFYRESNLDRKRTLITISQFIPTLIAGLVITFFLSHYNRENVRLLPGIWAVLFAIGIYSVRPYLEKHFIWVALFFLLGGLKLFLDVENYTSLSPWGMSLTFGAGLLLASAILYWCDERVKNG